MTSNVSLAWSPILETILELLLPDDIFKTFPYQRFDRKTWVKEANQEPAWFHFEGKSCYVVWLKISFYLLSCSLFPRTWCFPNHDLALFLRTPYSPWRFLITWWPHGDFLDSFCISLLLHCLPSVKLLVTFLFKRGSRKEFGATLINLTLNAITG